MSAMDAGGGRMMGQERELQSRVALVTGASRGIGRAVALALANAGADVALGYRTGEAEANDVPAAIEATGRRSVAVRADVSIAAEVLRLVESAASALGPVSILVNNA